MKGKVGIIGAGLGGLLAGVALAKKGYKVKIFERLRHAGGRFTNFEVKGFQLTTGALHMIPHGNNGPLARLLREVNANVKIFEAKPEGLFRVGGKDYTYAKVLNLFPLVERVKLSFILTYFKYGKGSDEILYNWLSKKLSHPLAFKITDSFCGWALSINSKQISTREFIAITKNIHKLRGPGIPQGGCKGVIDALVQRLTQLGGEILYKSEVEEILVEDNEAKKVVTSKEEHEFDVIISDIGPKRTLKLCGEENFPKSYVERIKKIREACGIKISIACDKPMLGFSGVLFTPEAKRISGLNEVTNADPSLAPKGKHLLMSHQPLDSKANVKSEAKLGIEDLHELFPEFERHCEILAVQVFKGNLPVNRAVSGEHIAPKTPIKNLYLVGDAIKPRGFMETEGIAAGVMEVLNYIAQ